MTTATDTEIPPEVRGYISRLQETIRDMEGQLDTLRALFGTGLEVVEKTLSHERAVPPSGVHEVADPWRIDHDEDGEEWSDWSVSCSCGWEEGGYERYGHAEMLARIHAGYYEAVNLP